MPLGQARVVRPGRDITLVSWGQQVLVAELAVRRLLAFAFGFHTFRQRRQGRPVDG